MSRWGTLRARAPPRLYNRNGIASSGRHDGARPGHLVPPILATWLSVFRPCFTAPVWNRILVLVAGAVLAPGKRTVTQVLRVMGQADEPSFRRYHEVLSWARWDGQAVARVLFNTNCTLIQPKRFQELIDTGLDELRVSLDAADRGSYAKIRGKDFFNRIVRDVGKFVAHQKQVGATKPRVSPGLTGLKETIDQLPEFVRLAAQTGVTDGGSAASRARRDRLRQGHCGQLALRERAGRRSGGRSRRRRKCALSA